MKRKDLKVTEDRGRTLVGTVRKSAKLSSKTVIHEAELSKTTILGLWK